MTHWTTFWFSFLVSLPIWALNAWLWWHKGQASECTRTKLWKTAFFAQLRRGVTLMFERDRAVCALRDLLAETTQPSDAAEHARILLSELG